MIAEAIDYKKVFYYFEKISSIPRGSGNNQGISDYLVEFAKEHGLKYIQDKALNVIIIKEASRGKEHCPAILIQGHMDMVCEKENGCDHDFTAQALELRVDGDFIYANGTTLGGDDGIALAYALALLEAEDLVHPRLEVVITTDEETGMGGALALDCSPLTGKYMLNLDSEEEGSFLISCAGGMTATLNLPLEWDMVSGTRMEIEVTGLIGGHSGMEINKNRTNATLLMGRMIHDLRKKGIPFSVLAMNAGKKDNAIPREAFLQIISGRKEAGVLLEEIQKCTERYQRELLTSEPGLKIEACSKEDGSFRVLTMESLNRLLFLLLTAPNGVQVMSSDVIGLVESSLNLGIFYIDENHAHFSYSVRSSRDSYKEFLSDKLKTCVEQVGGTYYVRGEYPAWEYKPDSRLRELCIQVFQKQYGHKPKIEAIHAGLECGIISEKIKDIDIVSTGPDILDIHTPRERMSISSVKRVYDFLIEVLERLCEEL